MAGRDINGAYALCQENPNSYSRVLSQALLKVNFERDKANKGSMDEAAAETLDQEETKQMIWVNYLNVFATLAPMLGLLGTVWGMIEAFDQLMQRCRCQGTGRRYFHGNGDHGRRSAGGYPGDVFLFLSFAIG